MNNRHTVEILIEASKKISKVIDNVQSENPQASSPQRLIEDLNTIIRDLDHVVEGLEKNR